ncbi:hypothetical protein [Aminipila sp.]|uniref:hypothetical protein n=1 Tax=Aminipila sp. TaxID=2060095 RepID=UPI00289C55C8|nr:hypothetical protein [Aminipila sp.]
MQEKNQEDSIVQGIQLELYFHNMENLNENVMGRVCKALDKQKAKAEIIRIYVPLYSYVKGRKRGH